MKNRLKQKRVVRLRNRNINSETILQGGIKIFSVKFKRLTEEDLRSIKIDLMAQFPRSEGNYLIKNKAIPNKVLTKKGILVRMGKGRGDIKTTCLYVTKGTIIFELIPQKGSSMEDSKFIAARLSKIMRKHRYLSFKYTL